MFHQHIWCHRIAVRLYETRNEKQAGPAKQQSTQTTSKPAGSYSAADFLRTQPKMQQTPTYKKPDSTNWNPLAEKKVKQQTVS